MNPMTDMFDFNKNIEQFSKFMPGFRQRGADESLHRHAGEIPRSRRSKPSTRTSS